jgi:ribonuclease-3
MIQEWSYNKMGDIPLYHFDEGGYQITRYIPFNGISQSLGWEDPLNNKTKWHCLLKLSDDLPIFRGFGQTQAEARYNVCKLAYDYLCNQGLWLSIRDEIEDPNKEDAINQLEILARRGYFSIPTYEFEQTYDKDGNPIWKSVCHIAEESKSFPAKSSSKKDAKKSAAYKMLQHVLND